jgi:hypothetical protein
MISDRLSHERPGRVGWPTGEKVRQDEDEDEDKDEQGRRRPSSERARKLT